eukprot:CAMPEP_0118673514 /NCGR_PEP_ID=MMETSP0800-20121206/366_1 /TAXON_ID=210618 ORGANISM="Striatella unipunctata, Strain CCMP2910" /NCGR_SAMPLE_ID=MMETSP0800 /ASSEMBLY_ACC=CAM_ASM_000638 /LENGTH=114 /DNA_ID=CAMNT_0006568589 /DNA_START=417 /DNA_END=757 /DNA_ORIENTATION=+
MMEAEFLSTDTQWMSQGSKSPDTTPFFDAGITGFGQVVAVSDSGLDTGSCYFKDFNKEMGATLKLDGSYFPTNRKIVQYIPRADDADVPSGHGTHVVGIRIHHGGEVVKDAKLA